MSHFRILVPTLFIAIACISFSAPASAATSSELAAQIQALMQQIQALQAQLDSTPTTVVSSGTNSSCVTLTRTLSAGSMDVYTGGEVSVLQRFLAQDSSLYSGTVTGYFGSATAEALKRWQARNGVVTYGSPSSTGYGATGPATRRALAAGCTDTASTQGTASISSSFSYMQWSGPLVVTGSASGTVLNHDVRTFLIPATYRYASDYNSLLGQIGKDGIYENTGGSMTTSGAWVARFPYVNAGSYRILIFDATTKALLTSPDRPLTVSADAPIADVSTKAPTCELSVTTPYQTRSGLTGTGYYDGSGSGYVETYSGDKVTIRFSSTNATYSAAPYGDKDLTNGSATYSPTSNTPYVWTFYGPGGSTKCGVMVEVRPSKTTTTLGSYRGYFDGVQFIATENITRDAAVSNCTLNATNNPSRNITCKWNGEQIYSRSATAPSYIPTYSDTTGTYQVYLNSVLTQTTYGVYETDARGSCASAKVNNSGSSVVCKWNGTVL